MGYIILSRKQVDGDLNVELVKNKPVADLQRKQLIKQYYDVVVLDKNDYDLLSKGTFKDWVHGEKIINQITWNIQSIITIRKETSNASN